ncbi:MAG: alpha/beta fold hydrolase [Anaerolineae bacterium]|jgi:N-formylmaleamate deformylase|nr:alpha/beta hydrolase [Chloroflexota bacterium]
MNVIDRWSQGDALANGHRIHYYRSGGPGQAILLAHGITDSGECWPLVAEALAPEYDVIAWDARGHGRSETPRAPFSTVDQANDLIGLVAALQLDKPVAIGHSMGANTVANAAFLQASLFSRIVLEDPPWRDPVPGEPVRGVASYQQRLADYHAQTVSELAAYGRANREGWSEHEFEPWARAKHLCRAETLERMVPGGPSWREVARGIGCPVLLLTGEPDFQASVGLGAIITAAVAKEAQSLLQQGRVVHIAHAGHNIRRENTADYIAAVRSFLREP